MYHRVPQKTSELKHCIDVNVEVGADLIPQLMPGAVKGFAETLVRVRNVSR